MTEDFKFHYTHTATGELSGESFVRQTEDGIAGIGKYAKQALEVASQSRDLSTETLERVRKTESNASNSIEIAKQAMTNVETCTTTLDKWRPIVNNANDISHQAISIARSSNEASSKAVETANHSETRSINAERAALDAQAKAEQSSVSSEKSSEAARQALDALNDAKAKVDASAHAAEAAGVKCVRYVGQSLSKEEKQVARVNIEAVRGTPDGAFIPAVRSPETAGMAGQIRFNADTNKFEGYDGAKWSGIGGELVDENNRMRLPASTAVYAGEDLAFKITRNGIQQSGTPSNGSDIINKTYLEDMLANNKTYLEKRILEMKKELQSKIKESSIPAGTIAFFAMSSVPKGWLLCNGSAVSRTQYADLFAAIGTKYGKGNGYATFNLPDMNDRFAEGTTSTSKVGEYVEAGLPNITGEACVKAFPEEFESGAIRTPQIKDCPNLGGSYRSAHKFVFDASLSDAIFGRAPTVQPSSLRLLACIKF